MARPPVDAGLEEGDAFSPRREGSCTEAAECTSGLCRDGRCAMPCSAALDCPNVRGWACAPGIEGRAGCTCEPSTAGDVCTDDVDSDCDGSLECLVCDGREVSPDDDASCGACGVRCAAGASCRSRACTCDEPGQVVCSGSCVDPSSDAAHCGGCGRVCPSGALCVENSCVCPRAGETACAGACVDLSTDTAHCGGCSNSCSDGEACVMGTCACPDPDERSCAGAGCVDVATDALHCGSCTTVCATGASCAEGVCSCPGDRSTECGGACVDRATDPAHCGACGRACPGGIDCVAGVCACPGSSIACGTSCVDTSTNRAHCGGCARVCSGPCVAGGCIEPRTIGAGDGFTCVLLRDGRVLCWGATRSGKLGDGEGTTLLSRAHPEPVLDVDDASFLSVGADAACVIRPGGQLWCWGDYGLPGSPSDRPVFTDTLRRPVVHVSMGYQRHCAVTDDGVARCWGEGLGGSWTVPGGFVQVATGRQHTCAMTPSRQVYCWGYNTSGQLGQGTTGGGLFLEPLLVSGLPATGVEIDAGFEHTCLRTSGRDVWCWGSNLYRQSVPRAGVVTNTPRSLGAYTVGWAGVWTDMDTGAFDTTCTVMGSGTLAVFGQRPLSGASPVSDAVGCSVGRNHGCVLRRNNVVSCWGTNVLNELGGGTTAYETTTTVDVRW